MHHCCLKRQNHFFYNEKNDSALILYKCVAECEKWLQSERLALCQFRIFVLGLGHEQEVNLENSVLFEPYLDRLEENYQFDAYMKLINIYRSLSRWDKVEELAIRMKQKAEIHYQIDRYLFISSKIPKKPIILYVLYANLMLGSVHRERGEYDRALYYVSQYDKPSWVKNSNEEEMVIINQFSEWATANRYLFSIMNGKLSELSNYIDFIDSRTDEIFPALCNIMIVANRHRINIDDILKRYQDYLVLKNHSCSFAKINEQVTMTRYTRLLAELGIYYIYSEEYDSGLSYIVDSLSYSLMIKSDKGVLRCMGIFQQYRHKATPETINRYAELIYQVQKSSIYEWRPLI
ncbi:hypothetical protein [Paenibacillus sp. JCM 10914]|uniref:hypothetical protein n=1 Tax=Paenibacillus sp. JCM 10914 TaxID=1236974 RepID=UPI0003CC73B6|nr:hypothetical protein JCM10914_1021 [Paenibacillus sp. JCM 10914]